MGARQSAEMKRAIKLVDAGKKIYEAARKTGIYPSSLYKALKARKRKL